MAPCLVNVPMGWAKPRPTARIASDALTSTPGVALASEEHRFGMKGAGVQGVYEAQKIVSLKPPV